MYYEMSKIKKKYKWEDAQATNIKGMNWIKRYEIQSSKYYGMSKCQINKLNWMWSKNQSKCIMKWEK